jgi:hypothetical protein
VAEVNKFNELEYQKNLELENNFYNDYGKDNIENNENVDNDCSSSNDNNINFDDNNIVIIDDDDDDVL